MVKSKSGVALILIGVFLIFVDWFILYWVENLLLSFIGIVMICIGICISVKSSKKTAVQYTYQPSPQYYPQQPSQSYQQGSAPHPAYTPQPGQTTNYLQPMEIFRFCPHCGAPVQGKFCVECGKLIQ